MIDRKVRSERFRWGISILDAYLYYSGKTTGEKISNKHLSPAVHSPETIADNIVNPSAKLLCINDVHLSDEDYERYRDAVLAAFRTHFPVRSRFELAE